ncbi:MAG: hypothetical protein RLZZ387_3450 [Chloroflexota bacterium]
MSEPSATPPSFTARYHGALLGLATGDALGTTLEFTTPGGFAPIDDMVGGGPFALAPGQWTDDTSMALCLAASLVERQQFDPRDQISRYVRWWRDGYMSSTGACFDIGNTTRLALATFLKTGDPYAGPTAPNTAGNGALMRLAPVPLAYAHDPRAAVGLAAESARVTHGAPVAVDACRYMAALIVGALRGDTKEALLAPDYTPAPGLWDEQPLHPEIAAIAAGSFRAKEPPAIRGSGYAAASLEAALWAFARGASFREGCLLAVNLGNDADTTGAVYGQLAGAYYGEEGIPSEWRERLALRDQIGVLADQLLALAALRRSR